MVQHQPILNGKTVAVTRPCGQAEDEAKIIRKMGGEAYLVPTIEIKPLTDPSTIGKFILELKSGTVDFVVFMSVNGVKHLLNAAESLKLSKEALEGLRKTATVAVGPRTADELRTRGIHVNLVPEVYTSEGIAEGMRQCKVSGKTVAIPRTSAANPILKEKLSEMGAKVWEIYVYDSALPSDSGLKTRFFEDLKSGKIDAVVFGSGLCAKNLFEMLKDVVDPKKLAKLLNDKSTVVAIGPVTEAALTQLGVETKVTPEKHTFEEALLALAQHWQTQTVKPRF